MYDEKLFIVNRETMTATPYLEDIHCGACLRVRQLMYNSQQILKGEAHIQSMFGNMLVFKEYHTDKDYWDISFKESM